MTGDNAARRVTIQHSSHLGTITVAITRVTKLTATDERGVRYSLRTGFAFHTPMTRGIGPDGWRIVADDLARLMGAQ